MSTRLKRNAHILKVLAHAHPSVRSTILRGANSDLVNSLAECSYNVIKGTVRLTPAQKAKLTRYKQQLRQVASKGVSIRKKCKIIQKGGFLPILLGPLLGSVIGPLAKTAISGIVKAIKKKKSK